MADNKIEDALEKAGEVLDNELGVEKIAPSIEYTAEGLAAVNSTIKSSVKIIANDYTDTIVRVKGTISNPELVELTYKEDEKMLPLPVNEDGTFWFGPTDGFPITDTISTFETKLLKAGELSIKLEVVRVEDSIVLCETEYTETILPEQKTILINAGKNCNGAILTINNEEKEFDTPYNYDVDSNIEINVTKEHYVTYTQTLSDITEITVDLDPAKYKLTITDNVKADTIDIHVGTENIHYIEPLTFEYGTKIIVTAKKEGYKNFQHIIDSLDSDVIINIGNLERIKYSLTINSPENSIVKVNGTENSVWPLEFEDGTEISFEVSKNHYETYTENFVITEDKIFDISLNLEKHTLTVTTIPNNSLVTINGEQTRQAELEYGSTAKIKVESIGYESVEKSIIISKDTNENIVLEKQQLMLTVSSKKEGILKGATFKFNGVDTQINSTQVYYGESTEVEVSKPGYPTFTTIVTLTEDTTIYVDETTEWEKPQVTVNIANQQDIVNPVVITVNGNVVSANSPVDVDYKTEVNIVVECDGYKTIEETKIITSDYNPYYELVDINSEKVKLEVNCELDGASITINGKSATTLYIEPNNEITVIISHIGYETITDKFIITDDTVKNYILSDFIPKNFKLTVSPIPSAANVTIDGKSIKSITVPYLTVVNVKIFAVGYLSVEQNIEVTKDETLSVKLELDPNYTGEITDGEKVTLEKIIEMLQFRKTYSYLNISRVFKDGYTEETVRAFYVKFGSYCTSRYDFMLWKMMHEYFGHVDNTPHPDTKG